MEGCLFTFIGPSGVGKSEIMKEINKKYPGLLDCDIPFSVLINWGEKRLYQALKTLEKKKELPSTFLESN